MGNVDPDDLIWIETAAEKYDRSRRWLNEQIEARKLSVASKPGDRKVYLLKSEIERLIAPRIVQPADEDRKSS